MRTLSKFEHIPYYILYIDEDGNKQRLPIKSMDVDVYTNNTVIVVEPPLKNKFAAECKKHYKKNKELKET